MPIPLTCPHCGSRGSAPDHYAGQAIRCPGCKRPVAVPMPAPAPLPEPEPEAPARRGEGVSGLAVVLGILWCLYAGAAGLLGLWFLGVTVLARNVPNDIGVAAISSGFAVAQLTLYVLMRSLDKAARYFGQCW